MDSDRVDYVLSLTLSIPALRNLSCVCIHYYLGSRLREFATATHGFWDTVFIVNSNHLGAPPIEGVNI